VHEDQATQIVEGEVVAEVGHLTSFAQSPLALCHLPMTLTLLLHFATSVLASISSDH